MYDYNTGAYGPQMLPYIYSTTDCYIAASAGVCQEILPINTAWERTPSGTCNTQFTPHWENVPTHEPMSPQIVLPQWEPKGSPMAYGGYAGLP